MSINIIKRVLALMATGALLLPGAAMAALSLDIVNVTGATQATSARLNFHGDSTFTFDDATTGGTPGFDFKINGVTEGLGDSFGLCGNISGTYTIGAISVNGAVEEAPITGGPGATLSIFDGTTTLSGSVDWIKLRHEGTGQNLNIMGEVNLTGITYTGSVQDLIDLKGGGNKASAVISFSFIPARSIAELKTQNIRTSYSGDLTSFPCVGRIGDFVWNDLNGDGIQDAGEPGIPGVQVDLYAGCNAGSPAINTTTTDLNGRYTFTGLCAGDYTVSFHTPVGYEHTTANVDGNTKDDVDSDCDCAAGGACGVCVTLPENTTVLSIDCGYKCSGQMGDFVWEDLNGNGLQDAGEPGINGVKVYLFQGADFVTSTVTDTNGINDGYYQFTGLCDGTYTVVVDGSDIPAGLTQTTVPGSNNGNDGVGNDSNNPDGTDVTLSDGQRDIQTIDFGFKPPCTGRIGDFVWNDLNGNGCQDGNEPGLAGVVVNLSSGCAPNTVTFVKTTTTDANGKYTFEELCAGSYTVSFVTPNGFSRTLANQSCNVGGQPSDETDSDCDCAAGGECGICVTLPVSDSVDLTIDCGYVGNVPCLTLTKSAASQTALAGSSMTYTYVLNNCGSTTYNNLAIIDDNATPGDPSDDFTVASGISLAPGETKSFTATVILPTPLCSGTGSPPAPAGSLDVTVLPSGDFKVVLTQSRNLNDNAYGTGAGPAGWPGGGGSGNHTFNHLVGSDKAEFRFKDSTGKVVLDFYLDYISAATSKTFPSGTVSYPSGYGTLGANGGDGSIVTGSAAHVLSVSTSLTENLNSGLNGCCPSPWLVNSPSPESNFPNWNYLNVYTVIVSKNAFGAAGFGGVTIPDIHNSPAKTGNNQVTPAPCSACIENIARVVAVLPGNIIGPDQANPDSAIVCIGTPVPPTPPCILTPGTLKIDKKTVQLPIKNNGTADILLSEVAVSWNQGVNGNLVKMSLNGDFWAGSAASGTAVNSGFNADANRRKIAKGQTKTLVLTFVNNASKTVSQYSGFIKFGSDASCALAFPPPAPPAPFDCDGHIRELKMKWNGTQPVKVVAHYGSTAATTVLATIDNVVVGQTVTVSDYTGSPNDVIWEIFQAGTNTKIGESQFHTSCSDSTMDGPEDCGSAQGNGKNNLTTVNGSPAINTWQFVGLTTIKGTTLLCPP